MPADSPPPHARGRAAHLKQRIFACCARANWANVRVSHANIWKTATSAPAIAASIGGNRSAARSAAPASEPSSIRLFRTTARRIVCAAPVRFFLRCNLRCIYCQNWEVSDEELAQMMLRLQALGCHNINLVTPSHVVAQILAAATIAAEQGLRLPLVYNTSGTTVRRRWPCSTAFSTSTCPI
jgi:hypothetical protein